jgi:hypothetical protein
MQLYTSPIIEFFDSTLRKKFNFETYTSFNKPTLFLGIYTKNDVKKIINHKGIKILLLNGRDCLLKKDDIINLYKNEKNFTIISGSTWIDTILDNLGIKYEKIRLFFDDIYNWKPTPLGKSVYWYKGNYSFYGKQYLKEVRKAIPNLNIITNDRDTSKKEDMSEIYKNCFLNIRPVNHDGMSQTVSEMALMGRISIWNSETPFSKPFKGSTSLVETILKLRSGYDYKRIARRSEGFFKDEERKWTDLILHLCGLEELDACNIFYEHTGRCGSIFRISRRSDVEKIGGFGDGSSVYIRPWFSDKMEKLGKKQLITSKNSGFIASEWKNDGNKGYGDIKDYYTINT